MRHETYALRAVAPAPFLDAVFWERLAGLVAVAWTGTNSRFYEARLTTKIMFEVYDGDALVARVHRDDLLQVVANGLEDSRSFLEAPR